MAFDANGNVPSATAILLISGIKNKVDVVFEGDIFAHQKNFLLASNETGNIAITLFCKNSSVLDLRCQIAAISTVGIKSK